ncbi:MAG: hypothetical protein WBH14_14295, partial [Albidovulum sp.]
KPPQTGQVGTSSSPGVRRGSARLVLKTSMRVSNADFFNSISAKREFQTGLAPQFSNCAKGEIPFGIC